MGGKRMSVRYLVSYASEEHPSIHNLGSGNEGKSKDTVPLYPRDSKAPYYDQNYYD